MASPKVVTHDQHVVDMNINTITTNVSSSSSCDNCKATEMQLSSNQTNGSKSTGKFVKEVCIGYGSADNDRTEVDIELRRPENNNSLSLRGLLDSGATDLFIDRKFVKGNQLPTQKLPRKIPVKNIDGTDNQAGSISETVTLLMRHKHHKEKATFYITDLGNKTVILGHTWLTRHNPEIDWRTGEITFTYCPFSCGHDFQARQSAKAKQHKHEKKYKAFHIAYCSLTANFYKIFDGSEPKEWDMHNDYKSINATSISTQIAFDKAKEAKSWQEYIPKHFWNWSTVFTKQGFDELPSSRPWDHAIELIPNVVPKSINKAYPLSRNEQKATDNFLHENLKTGRIIPSKSPWAAGFFHVKKKDGKLRPVQDYRPLNAQTVKNKYPLPLISELISSLKEANYFSKMDVRWGYNNVQIKLEDQHKAAF